MLNKEMSREIYYEITSQCNLKCAHCSDLTEKQIFHLSKKSIVDFHKSISNSEHLNSVITGGEPTLHKEFRGIVEELSKYGSVVITSNGVYSEKKAKMMTDLLTENPNVLLQISIDGLQDTFFKIRGTQLEPIINYIDELCQKGLNNQLAISFTLMKQNQKDINRVLEFAMKRGIHVHFPSLLPVGNASSYWDNTALEPSEQIKHEEQLLDTYLNKYPRMSINRVDKVLAHVLNVGESDCLDKMILKVNAEGDIYPCPAASRNKENVLGNITKLPSKDEILRKSSQICSNKQVLNDCATCSVNEVCKARFCSNCSVLNTPKIEIIEHECSILKYHYKKAVKEINSDDEND